jgi:hypothetical protein
MAPKKVILNLRQRVRVFIKKRKMQIKESMKEDANSQNSTYHHQA